MGLRQGSDSDAKITVSTSAPTFDDFDRVDSVNEATEKEEIKKEVRKEKEVKKILEKGEDKAEEISEEEPILEVPEENLEEENKDDGLIDVKINGANHKVSLEELKANYSGKVAYDKKFTEFDKERKSFQAEKEKLLKPIEEFKKLLGEGKAGDALMRLVDMAGEDVYTFNKRLIEAVTPIVKARLEMSPEQLEVMEAKGELEHLKKKEQSALERSKVEQTQAEFDQRIAKLQETYSISDDDFRTAAVKFKERLVASGKFKAEEFTPESVANFHINTKNALRTFKAIDAVDPKLESDSNLVSEMISLLSENPELSEADMVDLIKEYSGVNNKLKVLTEKAQVVKRVQAPSSPANKNRPEFFSDFED